MSQNRGLLLGLATFLLTCCSLSVLLSTLAGLLGTLAGVEDPTVTVYEFTRCGTPLIVIASIVVAVIVARRSRSRMPASPSVPPGPAARFDR